MERLLRNGKYRITKIVLASLLIAAGLFHAMPVSAGQQIQLRSITMGSSAAGETTSYNIQFNLLSMSNIGSVKVDFCADSPLYNQPCAPPLGFDISQAVLQPIDNGAGSTVDNANTTPNSLVITQGLSFVNDTTLNYTVTGVHNPSGKISFFGRIYTYSSTDASGSDTNFGGLAMQINDTVGIQAEVPPYLSFCVATSISGTDCSTANGNFVDVGTLIPGKASYGNISLLAATNADNGYTVRITGDTLSSGNNVIPALTRPTPSAPGLSQFGINLRHNNYPAEGSDPVGPGSGMPVGDYAIPDHYTYRSGDTILSSSSADDYRKYTTSYILNISPSQPPGVYNTTFTYIGLANF